MKIMDMKPQGSLKGEVRVPGDKSISHRAVMFGAVAMGETQVDGFLPGDDCWNTVACFRQMGVQIRQEGPTSLTVTGRGWKGLREPANLLDVGNSGTAIRLLLGVLAGCSFHSVVVGDQSIARRPMDRVIQPLRQMGARIDGRENGSFTPLSVRGGNLHGIHYVSPVASAQVKSCLLLAGLQGTGETIVEEPSQSRDHTERMLSSFGVELSAEGRRVSLQGGQTLIGRSVRVPGDISSAAFLMVAALIVPGSRITIRDVGLNPTRTGVIDALRSMGGDINVQETGQWTGEPVGDVTVTYSELQGVEISGDLIPRLIDEIPVLAVAATQAKGTTVIKDAAELKVKETNRIDATAQELRKLGAQVEETEDGLIIHGKTDLTRALCDSRGDHRIGMAVAVAGLATPKGVQVQNAEAIDISFPGFEAIWSHL
ncbi:3-phosphoshikimate 1-carboxyvinyltransferase [Kroppenstedtia pulmonis]|uniref:3-phosphoshikimate 1-carboxyvinyltransferase n=1 Tax=Kroppenstedtia pulmonis TaxID=1380685 RepID=A0A7D3Y9J1_9BACL|nr:3-phosphoshikimate 1-carboxyvinyltransferase [Kroppenstedtia pulmonis]